jgi:hypothetical protein
MLMLPKRVPLQIYVQETLQKSARFFTVYLLVGAACLVSIHISLLKLLLFMVVSIRRRLMIILIAAHGFCFIFSLVVACFIVVRLQGRASLSYICGGLTPVASHIPLAETDMVGYVLDALLNSDSRPLCTEYLLTCVRLLRLARDPPLTLVRKYLHDQLLQYRTDLEQRSRALPATGTNQNLYT